MVTNVPVPQHPHYFCGAEMVSYIGTGPLIDRCGLSHPVTSYCGELGMSVTSCRTMMPDPSHDADCIEVSFAELSEATA